MPTGNGEPRFTVRVSGAVAAILKKLQHQAWREHRGEAFLTSFQTISQRLTHDAREFGEPLYRLPALKLQVRHGIVGPLMVYFAVHDDEPLVLVKGAALLPE